MRATVSFNYSLQQRFLPFLFISISEKAEKMRQKQKWKMASAS
jgi:hypothetical protein